MIGSPQYVDIALELSALKTFAMAAVSAKMYCLHVLTNFWAQYVWYCRLCGLWYMCSNLIILVSVWVISS